ncbi:MAG: peptidylprolyl isomerase, partial [Planctomycetota bacterium]
RSRMMNVFHKTQPKIRNRRRSTRNARTANLETLERRQLLAGDIGCSPDDSLASQVSQVTRASTLSLSSKAEGEAMPDLVQFAQAIAGTNTRLYGAAWSSQTTEQMQLFADGANELPFVEVTNPDGTVNDAGIMNNITQVPTWIFDDGSRAVGVLSLEELSQRTGISIPTSETPTFEELGNQTVEIGSPLHLAIDAYDPNGNPLTVTISVEDESLLEASVVTGNRSMRIDMVGYGDMVFELFEQRAPLPTGRVIELAESGFYDDIIFHRVIDDFVIQTGDPTGAGSGGSSLGDFDDQFHPELQHNRPGLISYAKSSDDTNDSQFFVTEAATRFLDFNHSVFGLIVEGDEVREAISVREVDGNDRPTVDIRMDTVDIFEDTENSVIMLKPTGSGTGLTNVTVTVSDGEGNSSSETFQVSIQPDTENAQPYLDDISVLEAYPLNVPAVVQLTSTDLEGDDVEYEVTNLSTAINATVSVSSEGELSVTPPTDFEGVIQVRATVRAARDFSNNSDNQVLEFRFAPIEVSLSRGSDSGVSDTDGLTNETLLTFVIDGTVNNATGELLIDGQVAESFPTMFGSTEVLTDAFADLADGTYEVTARTMGDSGTFNSDPISITIDRARPVFDPQTLPSSVALGSSIDQTIGYLGGDVGVGGTGEFSKLIEARLVSAPESMSLSVDDLRWTPQPEQLGRHTYRLRANDAAGNETVQTFGIEVTPDPNAQPLVELTSIILDRNGVEVSEVEVGEPFQLVINAIDLRDALEREGVFGAYVDLTFDPQSVETRGLDPLQFGAGFELLQNGLIANNGIDELGAASTDEMASGNEVSTLVTIDLVATAAGPVSFLLDPAEDVGRDVLLYGIDREISPSEVRYSSANLQINASWHRESRPADVNGDGNVSPVDALLIINLLGREGSSVNVYETDLSAFDPDVRYDVDASGVVSPLDALIVINTIARGEGEGSGAEGEQIALVDRIFEVGFGNEEEEDQGIESGTRLF